jgi:hypothetical protein
MQIQLDDIAGRKGGLRQVREEQFVDHAFSCDTHWALLFACRMGGHDHAAGRPLRAHRGLRTIVEAANQSFFLGVVETDQEAGADAPEPMGDRAHHILCHG